MRILLILKETNMHERLGVMYLSSALKLSGHKVKLVLVHSVGIKGLEDCIRKYSPDIIGYSVMTGEHIELVELNRYLKEQFNFIAVFGGPHATFFSKLIYEKSCDAVCRGEGDLAFPEFCRRVEKGQEYWHTPNFIVKHKGEIYTNSLMPLIEDLDSLPFPDRHLMYEADPDLEEEGPKKIISGRGCPSKCSYCFNVKYNELYEGKGKVVRYRSPGNLIGEICEIKKNFPLDIVDICDDIFSIKPKSWFEGFARLYKKEVGLPFYCNMRPNFVTEENVSLLKETGLDVVAIGVECGDEWAMNTVLNRNITIKQIKDSCRILKKYGIKIITNNLNGLPVRNSFQIDLKTLDLNIEIKPVFAWSSIVYPYPNTPIEIYARSQGFLKETKFLETSKRSTMFEFSPGEKRRIESLHKLFGVIVEYPFLRKFTFFLCNLPLGIFYRAIYYMWYGYCFKIRIWPFRSVRKEIGKYIRYWWKLMFKT